MDNSGAPLAGGLSPVGLPPAVAQFVSAGSNGVATAVVTQLASAPAAGSVLVAIVGSGNAAAAVGAPAGWTAALDAAGHACRTTGAAGAQGEQVFLHQVAAGEAAGTYKFKFSLPDMYAVSVMEIQDVSAAHPIDACGAATANDATGTVAAPKLTAAAAGELPVAAYAPSTTGLTVSPKSGWTAKTFSAAQTKWMTLDTEIGPLTASAAAAVAPSTTFGNLGGTSIVFVPSVSLLFAGSVPAATPKPTAAPPATPVIAQTGTPVGTSGNAKALSASLPKAPSSAGTNYLLAWVGMGDSSATVTPPSGWAVASDASGHACSALGGADQQGETLFVHKVAAGDSSGPYAFGFSKSSGYGLTVMEVDDVSATSPIETCATSLARNSPAAASAPPLKTSVANELPLVGYAPSTSGLTVADASGWTSTVYDNAQTPYLTLDVEAHGAVAAGTITPTTTFQGGSGTIVYVPAVGVTIVPTGSAVAQTSPTAVPIAGPVATTAPTVAPTATPTPTPAPAGTLQNGVEWPTGFTPYAASSIWNKPISNTTNPTLLANSAAIVAVAENGDTGTMVRTSEFGAPDAVSHPVVFASASDPVVTTQCRLYCNPATVQSTLHIPAKAREASGSDHHLAVVQPDGTEDDMWLVTDPGRNWQTGDTLSYGSGANCGNFYTGTGVTTNAATAGGACLGAGIVRAAELKNGVIPHALFMTVSCVAASYVYPASQQGDNRCTGAGPHVPFGAHIWLSLSDSAINAMPVQPWEKAVMHALHDYGGYTMDSGGQTLDHATGLVNVMMEDGAQFNPFGTAPPMDAYAQSQAWAPSGIGSTTEYIAAQNWDPTGAAWKYLEILAPCYAQGSC